MDDRELLKPGDRIGDWCVVSLLGTGGMGAVYRCTNALTPRIVVGLKVLQPDGMPDADERFSREAETLAALDHPSVVRVLGFGEDPARKLRYLAMEHVEGEDLASRVARGPMPPEEARRLLRDVAAGLAHAHSRAITHRDLKPGNVIAARDGSFRIIDFGIALEAGRSRLTAEGLVLGTLAYLPPEAFRGDDPHPLRMDVYALGLLVWEASTGTRAFPEEGRTDAERMSGLLKAKTRAAPLDPGPAVGEPTRSIVIACTQPDPKQRPRNAGEVVAWIERDSGTAAAAAAGAPAETERRPWLFIGLGAGGMVAVAAVAIVAIGLAFWLTRG